MEQNARHREHIQRDLTRSEKEEGHNQDRSEQTNTTTKTKKTKHQRRFRRTLTHIINLSKYQLTPGEISLLSKGLNFIPTPKKECPAKLLQDILLYDRRLRLKYFFHQDSATTTESIEEPNSTLHPSSQWTLPSGQDPSLESYRSTIIHSTLKEIKKKDNKKFKRNFKKGEWIAINTLRRNENIVIKPADKGGNIVIMNKEDYIHEELMQLSDQNFYEELEEDPTQNYNNQIYQVLHQAANLNIIDDKMKKHYITKHLESPISTCYQKYINLTTLAYLLSME